jgi:hypothetical protein
LADLNVSGVCAGMCDTGVTDLCVGGSNAGADCSTNGDSTCWDTCVGGSNAGSDCSANGNLDCPDGSPIYGVNLIEETPCASPPCWPIISDASANLIPFDYIYPSTTTFGCMDGGNTEYTYQNPAAGYTSGFGTDSDGIVACNYDATAEAEYNSVTGSASAVAS